MSGLRLLSGALLLAVVAACAPAASAAASRASAPAATAPVQAAAAPPAPAASPALQALIDGARKEGSLSLVWGTTRSWRIAGLAGALSAFFGSESEYELAVAVPEFRYGTSIHTAATAHADNNKETIIQRNMA